MRNQGADHRLTSHATAESASLTLTLILKVPLLYAVGNAIPPGPPNSTPTDAQVEALHELFCVELKRVFDVHKVEHGWGHKELRLV